MGKQKGDGSRSKNRPSNSNFAASLLQSGAASVGFGGYVGSSRIDTTLTKESNTLLDVDGEVAQHLRRLSKKDPVTKIKALTSLSSLFRQCSASDLCQLVPQWVFEYKRLVQDNNRQVRQTAHDAMANLAITIGRSLAPHLRSLMGAWWLGQFDPYTEVAEAARRSFQAAFPVQEKRLEALAFCENEIFLYLDENFKLTPQTISDKTAPTEELEEMHQRVVSSSMLALASLLDVLLGPPLQRTTSENGSLPIGLDSKNGAKVRSVAIAATDKIFHTHNFFQEFLKSRNSRVRSAVYQVFASFLKYIPQVVSEGNMKILAGAILGSFQEKDPNCHSSMWDMLLLFMKRFPEAWKIAPVQKMILPRFWCFLRHGCYGSHQTSYPCLLLMIVSIPPTIISAEQFCIEFFQNLWAGRSTLSTSPADRAALFAAIKECLVWLLNNASRFVEGSGCIEQFCVKLVDHIIFRLLWCDYITLGRPNADSGAAKGTDDNLATKKIHNPKQVVQDNLNLKHLEDFKQDLGNSIIDILSIISIKDPSLLHVFCTKFQTECLKMIEQGGSSALPEGDQHMNYLSDFFLLLGTHSMNKGEKWPLVHLARPFAAKSYPVIKSMALPASINLLSVIISVFGPSVLPVESYFDEEGESHLQMSTSYDQESKPELLLQFFKADIATWCLHGNNLSTISRIDLLLSFLEDAYFQNEWDWVVGCAAGMENGSVEMDCRYLNNDHITVLATLMEKVRYKFICRNVSNKSSWNSQFEDKNWHSARLDTVAIRIACDKTLKCPSHVLLLRYILGGTEPEDTVSLVSTEALNLIMEEILRQLVGVLRGSPNVWAKHAASLILSNGMEGQLKTDISASEEALQVASFAIQVLGGSFFSLKILDGYFQVVPHILAASICLDWERKMSQKSGQKGNYVTMWELDEDARIIDEVDTSSYSEGESIDEFATEQADEGAVLDAAHELGIAFAESMRDLLSRIEFFSKSFSLSSCERLRSLLIGSIRCCIFEEDKLEVENVVALCTKWMVKIMDYTCKDQNEEQQLLDYLLLSHEAWPFWSKTSVDGESKPVILKPGVTFNETEKVLHTRFLMFVERIGSIIGKDKLFIGSLTRTSQITVEHMSNQICNKKPSCRIWLALEVLCTWRWPGGSAMEFLLPFLCECAKSGPGYPEWMMVNSIIDILFLGALKNNMSSRFYPPNVWVISDDEVNKIEEPFLRALIMLLIVLFKDGIIWNSRDASRILQDYILKEEFLSIYVNTYVRLLPHILNVLAPVVWKRTVDLEDCNKVLPMAEKNASNLEKAVCQWLERANSGPPLILCQKDQSDVEDWVNVAISCFPLSPVGRVCALTMASSADISNEKRKLLLSLFQKQASQKAISEYRARAAEHRASLETSSDVVTYWEPTTELCLAKLMAVSMAYCWQEFGEDDWVFVLAQLRKWLDVAVSSMEDLAEGVNNVVRNTDPCTSLEIDATLKSIENVIKSSKISSVELTEMAVFIFSLLFGLHNLDGAGLNSLKLVNWERAEARAFENILRLFFATGIAESIASSSCAGKKAGTIIALSRQCNAHFWECVANVVVDAPSRAKEASVHATELWGLSKGAISALYEILFSVDPIAALQLAAYHFLSSDSIQPLAVTKGVLSARLGKSIMESEEAGQTTHMHSSSDESSVIREELSHVLQTSSSDLLGSNFTALIRVKYLLAWSLFLTRLQAVPSLSAARECMVQYAQDSGSPSTLLDCLFQHILIKQSSISGSKKYNAAAIEANGPASAAKRSVATSSLYFAVEALWPIDIDKMAALAGAVYGLMLRVLPAYVRDWIINLRDRPAASFIEAFTTTWCSHQLLDDEFSKIQAAGITDESLSIRANRSAREVTAIYTKEEAVMDVVIRLPLCYPLRPVDMECTRKIGVNETNLRKWMLSMTSFVRNQNGAVSEAIQIWKRHINREFEGVEECPICYSIVHSANHSLPRLACKTCKHKYHAACLYKWFSTSLKSTCPLCQSPF
ncbi:hypothetical protein SUGI_0766400 [Cryptomeria japonica]|uniref:E3 ubiquitin-protein ligase listerin isoform X2 n=1 Tax=Cryptomeria japonica TaxID=3369 RepID=UPI002414B5E5|nr:E3 ubiquitin-protein ligase listerin isoform X2 [Cryptomeria japonica]GLJ37723.1 hypothetical protein SUGI_0766400 [Cryptomeria japonica]